MTTASTTSSLQEKLTRHLGDVDANEKAIGTLKNELTAITNQLESPEHAKGIFSGDEKAHRLDEDLAKKLARIEKQISVGMKDAAKLRTYVDDTLLQIADARRAELLGVAVENTVSLENLSQAVNPLLEELCTVMARIDAGCTTVKDALSAFPSWVSKWTGKYFLSNVAERHRYVLMAELNRIVSGQTTTVSPEFLSATSEIFSAVHRAFETISATASGGGPGRKFYRACNGAISGVSGGLNLAHGDVIALPDDNETRKLVDLGALELVEVKK